MSSVASRTELEVIMLLCAEYTELQMQMLNVHIQKTPLQLTLLIVT